MHVRHINSFTEAMYDHLTWFANAFEISSEAGVILESCGNFGWPPLLASTQLALRLPNLVIQVRLEFCV